MTTVSNETQKTDDDHKDDSPNGKQITEKVNVRDQVDTDRVLKFVCVCACNIIEHISSL